MKREELIDHLDSSTEQLLEAITQFSQAQFNTIPVTGGWTGGQVVQHLYKAESGIPAVLKGNVSDIQRNPGEKIPEIEAVFLDFNAKYKSPEEILPDSKPKDKDDYSNRFAQLRNELRSLAQTLDLSATCTDFPFPGMGELTRLEWLWFLKCHSERHTRQLNKIFRALSGVAD